MYIDAGVSVIVFLSNPSKLPALGSFVAVRITTVGTSHVTVLAVEPEARFRSLSGISVFTTTFAAGASTLPYAPKRSHRRSSIAR